MLVLTRRLNEVVWIGDMIQVKVVGLSNSQVKLGFSAPDDLDIVREESLEPPVEVEGADVERGEP